VRRKPYPPWAKTAYDQSVSAATPGASPVLPVPNPCPRFKAGSVVTNPPALYSQNGVSNVSLSYQQRTDSAGRTLFCFMTPEGLEEPTLHVNPGDTLNITVTNNTPASPVEEPFNPPNCGDTSMTGSSVNIHYHGTNTSPACGADNVTKTLINSGTTFQYSVTFPATEPPGLYWYHPHVHMLSEAAVYGGAAGALIVDGIQNVQPAVSGLQEQILIIRDQLTLQQLPESARPWTAQSRFLITT
jgi:FtsP/CotA-like multicopper oxidase with cupredoxin domain